MPKFDSITILGIGADKAARELVEAYNIGKEGAKCVSQTSVYLHPRVHGPQFESRWHSLLCHGVPMKTPLCPMLLADYSTFLFPTEKGDEAARWGQHQGPHQQNSSHLTGLRCSCALQLVWSKGQKEVL